MVEALTSNAVSIAKRISEVNSYINESVFTNLDVKDYGEVISYIADEIERFRKIDRVLTVLRHDIDKLSRQTLQWLDTMEGKRYELIEKVNIAEGKTSNFNPIGFVDQTEGIYNDIAAVNDEGEIECIPVTEPGMYSYMSLIRVLKDSEKNSIRLIRGFVDIYIKNQVPMRMDRVLLLNRKIIETLGTAELANRLSGNDVELAKKAFDTVRFAAREIVENIYAIHRWILQISKANVATDTNYDLYTKAVSVVSDVIVESFQDVDGIYGWGSI